MRKRTLQLAYGRTPAAITATANYTVTDTNSGGNTTASVSITVDPVTYRYVYAASAGDNSVSTHAVNSVTGSLRFVAKAATGSFPTSVTVDPSGRYA